MTAAIINYQDIVPYAPIPKAIAKLLTPRELQLFSIMLGLSRSGTQNIWLRQETAAEWISCSIDTAGRTIRALVKKGLAEFTGRWHQGRHKVYKLCTPKSTYGKNARPRTADLPDHVPQNCQNLKEQEKTKEKEQQVVQNFSQKEFSSNEKIAIKQKLKLIGLTQVQISKLTHNISKSSSEILNNQINHLQYLLEQGQEIANQPGWLIKAVKENFKLPSAIDPTAIKQEQESLERREALRLAQDAAQKNLEGNHDSAKQLALKSLALSQNTEAQEQLTHAEEALAKSSKLEELKKTLPIAKISELLEQSFADVMKEFRKTKAEIAQSAGLTSFVNQVLDQKILHLPARAQ